MRAPKIRTDIRQKQIAQAALDLIAEQGLHAVSIAAIAERVGIVPSAVYRHYKGKDDVLDAVLNLLRDRLLGNVASARKETGDALGRLQSLFMRHVRMLAENRAIPHVVFSEGIYSGHPERKRTVRGIMTRYLGKIAKIVREGQRAGSIRPGIRPKTVSVMFLGMILPAAVARSVTDGRYDITEHARTAWPLFEGQIAMPVERGNAAK